MSRPVGMIHDPDAEKRSPMLQRKVLCNGERTGIRCDFYWTMIRNEPSANPDFLVMGGKLRFCRAWGPEPLEFGEGHTELATSGVGEPLHRGCTMYRPAGGTVDVEALVQIARTPKQSPDGKWTTTESFVYADAVEPRHRYDPVYEDPNVYVDANVESIRKAFAELPLRADLMEGAIAKEHEAAFAATPGRHGGAPFGVSAAVSIADVLGDLDEDDDLVAPVETVLPSVTPAPPAFIPSPYRGPIRAPDTRKRPKKKAR